MAHIDGLMDALRGHVPKALRHFEADSIHQARVATRRLKAALDLLEPATGKKTRKAFGKILRDLRRRLGPQRDTDVMLGHVAALGKPARHREAARWLAERLEEQREQLRADSKQDVPAPRVLAKLGRYWEYREDAAAAGDKVPALLAHSLHMQLDAFAEQADRLTVARAAGSALAADDAVAEMPVALNVSATEGDIEATGETDLAERLPPAAAPTSNGSAKRKQPAPPALDFPDPHELRIAGKSLRYTLEMAAAQGHKVPKSAAKIFKAMQEHLGVWHDLVVLSDQALRASVDALLAHHHPRLHDQVLDLSRLVVRKSVQQLDGFAKQWSAEGKRLAAAIRAAFPLTPAASVPEDAGKPEEAQDEAEAAPQVAQDEPLSEATPAA